VQVNRPSGKEHPGAPLETSRLILRRLGADDAGFILELLNEPSFLRFVGDKGVRTLEDAARYISEGPGTSYRVNGYGLYLVANRETGQPMGISGLVRRDWLDAPDIGFSLRPAFWSRGYAREAAAAVLEQAATVFGLRRILAITTPDNRDSIRLLERLGFTFWKKVRTPDGREELDLRSTVQEPGG
jgi:RimJ/RimL family protein N-acetyltransferase